jgi:hypothetical protein
MMKLPPYNHTREDSQLTPCDVCRRMQDALEAQEAKDPVSNPGHYHRGSGHEAIDVIEAWDLGFHLGNTLKYIARAGRKCDALEDLLKARWYFGPADRANTEGAEMSPDLYHLLAARCRGRCEACRADLFSTGREVDHFFGRAKAEEVESTCWALCPRCHYQKTRNHPDSSHWLRLFIAHCVRWGYVESAQRADARLVFVDTRRELGARL